MSEKVMSSESDRWAWLRRYRAWSASRKPFEYPENSVEPEKPVDVHDPQAPDRPL